MEKLMQLQQLHCVLSGKIKGGKGRPKGSKNKPKIKNTELKFWLFCAKPRWGVPLVNPKPFYSALTFLRNCRQKELVHVRKKTDTLKITITNQVGNDINAK